jgi:uncharacterized cupredoxin-like copper-binding protein
VAVNSFDKSSRTATVTLGPRKLRPKLSYTGDLSGKRGHLVMLAAKLTVDGAPVPNQPVLLTLAGHSCLLADTDATGRARCRLTDNVGITIPGVGAPIKASFTGDSVYKPASAKASFDASLAPVKTPIPQPASPTTVVVTAGKPSAFAFTLSTAGQAAVHSDSARKLELPPGSATFDVTNSTSSILSHDFKVCSSNTGGKANKCVGTRTPVLTPGASASLTIDLTQAGTYEYLSTVPGDALAGMKGDLVIT